MTNNEIKNKIEKDLDNIFDNLQLLRDRVSTDTQIVINEMLTSVRVAQGKCFELSNKKDVYLS